MLDTTEYDPYTPKTISEIVGNTSIWKELATQIQEEKVPHLLLCGPSGCGKSLFLKMALHSRPILRIDCTANAGLRDSRDSIRAFAKGGKTATGQFRWILFEHADALHADTQAFLRRMLETTSAHTRIVLEVRDIGTITEPLVSRTTLVHVRAPEETELIYELLRRTNFEVSKDIIKQIVFKSKQNVRTAVLEVLAFWKGVSPREDQTKIMESYLSTRPTTAKEWVSWTIQTEQAARLEGIDVRDILMTGWPHHPIVSQTLAQWSRLGGTSCRALFFTAVYEILRAEGIVK
jgi:DNA polymerase III delta prime subunit